MASVGQNGTVASTPDRVLGQRELGRRSLLLAVPLGVVSLVSASVADSLLSPVGEAAARAWDQAGALVDDIVAASISTPATTPGLRAMEDAVLGAIGSRSTVIGVSVRDRRTGVSWHYRGSTPVRTGSVAKALIVAQALRLVRRQGRALSTRQKDQARLAITRSDNASADALYAFIGRHDGIVELATDLGLVRTAAAQRAAHWGQTLTTPNDLVRFMEALAGGHPAIEEPDSTYLLGLMGRVIDGQRWGVGTVGSATVDVRVKNGWMLVDNPWVINSVGDVRGKGRDYALAVMQRAQPDQRSGMTRASRIGRAVFGALEDPLR